jgi:hypothetical protein
VEGVVRLPLGLGIPELGLTTVVEVMVDGLPEEALELADEVIVLTRVDPADDEAWLLDDDEEEEDDAAVSLAWRRNLWLSVG